MKFKITIEDFFIASNPLFWLYGLITLIWSLLVKLLNASGVKDWYYVLKQKKGLNKKSIKAIKAISENNDFFWLKRQAWKYAAKNN